jgi:hypothetical protein
VYELPLFIIQVLAEVENQTKITNQEQLRSWAIKVFKKKKNENG